MFKEISRLASKCVAIAVLCVGAFFFPAPATAQVPGCCQLAGPSCGPSDQPGLCEALGGQFYSGMVCGAADLCVPQRTTTRLRRPPARQMFFRPHPPIVGRFRPPQRIPPHGPHATQVAAPTATPTPTPPPGPGCCELLNQPNAFCSAPTDSFSCAANGGVFVADASCDIASNRCAPAGPGCCQLSDQDGPRCMPGVFAARCAQAGGAFLPGGACDRASGLCSTVPRCGNGFVESGEECEVDADCAAPIEGCTDTCQCAGGVEVWLRWTDQNDLNLSLIDPRGRVYVAADDDNRACVDVSNKPDESIFLAPGRAPIGCYTVRVEHQTQCPQAREDRSALDIRLNVEGYKSTVHDIPGPAEGEVFETTFGIRVPCQ